MTEIDTLWQDDAGIDTEWTPDGVPLPTTAPTIEQIQAMATDGLISPSSLPLPSLRGFLNERIEETVRDVSTW